MPRALVGPPPSSVEAESAATAAGLAARWFQPDPAGGNLRDRTLDSLRTPSRDGTAAQPPRDLRGIKLGGEDLSGLDLSGADLTGADLSGADLSGCRLVGATLRGSTLVEARLSNAELLNADLTEADLSECSAERAGFGGAELKGALLFRAGLEHASFSRASLCGADLRAADLQQARFLEADLTNADLARADLRGADFEKSRVDAACFTECDMRRSRVRGVTGFATADWIGADILDVDFCGAWLMRRAISDQNYLMEFRRQGRLHAALYWLWWVTSDCGRSFGRWALWTLLVMGLFAGLFQLVDVDYGDHGTFLSPVYYSVVTLTTLGYGDAVPASVAAQLLAMIEVSIGYVMLGGLLSIFSNKMARRAD